MGFLETLTLIFIVLKLMGVVGWSWLIVLSPLFCAIAIYVIWFTLVILFGAVFATPVKKKIRNKR